MTDNKVKATVVVPTFNHGRMLYLSVGSVLSQTEKSLEVFIVGDGATSETKEAALALAEKDSRIRFFDNPKGPRRGEAHRHKALQEARGEIVCYIADDSLWLPHHVENLYNLLQDHDFATALPLRVTLDNALEIYSVDLSNSRCLKLMKQGINQIPLTSGAHRLDFYRKLPWGWRAAPEGCFTDLYMWLQILEQPGCRAKGSIEPSTLTFPSWMQKNLPQELILKQLESWASKIQTHEYEKKIRQEVYQQLIREHSQRVLALPSFAWKVGMRILRGRGKNPLRRVASLFLGAIPR